MKQKKMVFFPYNYAELIWKKKSMDCTFYRVFWSASYAGSGCGKCCKYRGEIFGF